jgi:hypothetical protein
LRSGLPISCGMRAMPQAANHSVTISNVSSRALASARNSACAGTRALQPPLACAAASDLGAAAAAPDRRGLLEGEMDL